MIKTLMFVLALSWVWCADSHGYVRTTSPTTGTPAAWPEGTVTLHIQVGCPVGKCYERATLAAAQAWNAVGADFTFQVGAPHGGGPVSCTEDFSTNNGRVTVFWASDQRCSPPISSDFVAVAHVWMTTDGRITDADIEFNDLGFNAFRWGVYTGPAQVATYDFQRIALHELGHVLGLDHPDDHGQHVPAIMNSQASHLYRLQPDDIAGVRAIYPPQVAVTKGALENPGPDASKTGIGVVSGWVCDADKVEVVLAGWRASVAYKLIREDTRSVCGDADNGFMVLVNWNLLGDGTQRILLLADGHELATRTVYVQTYGTEFLTGMQGPDAEWIVRDWPREGTDTIVGWTESLQNMEIIEIIPR